MRNKRRKKKCPLGFLLSGAGSTAQTMKIADEV
jgi:hypothetical protein